MLWATNSTAETLTANSVIPIDTLTYATNDNATLVSNAVQITQPGWYTAGIEAVLSNATASTVTVGVQLMAENKAVDDALMTISVPASGAIPLTMIYPVKVIPANSGTASLTWTVTAGITVDSVTAFVERKV